MREIVDRAMQKVEADRLRSSIKKHKQPVELISKGIGAAFYAQQTAQRVCPACGKAMQRRTAKKASGSYSQFWGCTAYPACKTLIAFE